MSLSAAIRKRSRTYVVERTAAVTVDPLTGRGLGGTVATGTILAHIQGFDGARRVDSVAGVDTTGLVKVWVADEDTVALDDLSDGGALRVDPGEGGSGSPGDVLRYDGHRWLVIERQSWSQDGGHNQYLARDEGAV